jgi:CheY-like chemotaxis protein
VLVADVPEMKEVLGSCFRDQQLTHACSFDAAVRQLRLNPFDLIVIGLHFDESRMFVLMQFIRSLPQCSRTPIICVRGMPSILSSAAREGIRHAVLAAGGDAFVDFGLSPSDLGELRERLAGIAQGAKPAMVFDEPHSSLRH